MMNDERNIKHILHDQKLAPLKSLGQNFLVNPQIAARIVELSGIGPDDTVVEFGVGFGSLTIPLAARSARVIGLEIDAGIIRWHKDNAILPDHVTLIHQDLLKADLGDFFKQSGQRLRILANLPYSVSNPLLFRLIEHRQYLEFAVLMLQKEVAARLTAAVGTKNYGVLSVLLGSCATIEKLLELGPGQFHPRPKVDSTVVRITFNPTPERLLGLPDFDYRTLKTIVNSAFQQRRKTLLNALSAGKISGGDKKQVRLLLEECGLAPEIRAERLSVQDYIRLANLLDSKKRQDAID